MSHFRKETMLAFADELEKCAGVLRDVAMYSVPSVLGHTGLGAGIGSLVQYGRTDEGDPNRRAKILKGAIIGGGIGGLLALPGAISAPIVNKNLRDLAAANAAAEAREAAREATQFAAAREAANAAAAARMDAARAARWG